MDYFGGLDVSVKDTSVCIVDGTGKIVREVKVASEPQALLAVLRNATYCFKRIGLEAGPLSQWLYGELVEPLLIVRQVLREQLGILHRRLLAIVRDDDVCRRLMTIPGVGPVVALTYRATVDVPIRFRKSKAVGAVFGLTPAKYQSGESNPSGGISRCRDEMMRAILYEAAHIMLGRVAKWSWLKAW